MQTAYRVLEATSEEKIVEGAADVWDSGKVKSSDNTGVSYGGEALEGDKGQKLYHVPKDETVQPKGEAVFLRTFIRQMRRWDISPVPIPRAGRI